jgi:hypothetical protein
MEESERESDEPEMEVCVTSASLLNLLWMFLACYSLVVVVVVVVVVVHPSLWHCNMAHLCNGLAMKLAVVVVVVVVVVAMVQGATPLASPLWTEIST